MRVVSTIHQKSIKNQWKWGTWGRPGATLGVFGLMLVESDEFWPHFGLIFFTFSLQDGFKMPSRCNLFSFFFWHRFLSIFIPTWPQLGPNLAPTWPPNPPQNPPKSHQKSIPNRILFLICFLIDFSLIFHRFSTPKSSKNSSKINPKINPRAQ